MAGSGAIVCEPAFGCGDWQQPPLMGTARTIYRSKPRRIRRVPPAVAGRVSLPKALSITQCLCRRRLSNGESGGAIFAVGFYPGRGHCRDRILRFAASKAYALDAALIWRLFLRFDNPPFRARQHAASDGVNVGQFGARCPALRRTVAAHVAIAAPAAGAGGARRIMCAACRIAFHGQFSLEQTTRPGCIRGACWRWNSSGQRFGGVIGNSVFRCVLPCGFGSEDGGHPIRAFN